ncbi:hypothetical protein BC936DRAFT_142407 [Jimgerdemannia flammicorona]|uniref:Uncharacterized protein n=1 Tax=Jimgerdemannia flammicorona TaxID=994334 RepID=A0A433DF47_9FUNG|nr:hypothetical protein BC936DRAFT_142407 [Jimgerdemannia flammicorona]
MVHSEQVALGTDSQPPSASSPVAALPLKRGQYKKRKIDPNWIPEDDRLLADAFAEYRDDWIKIKRAMDHRKNVPEIRKRAKELNLVTTLITGESPSLIVRVPVSGSSKRTSKRLAQIAADSTASPTDGAAEGASMRSSTSNDVNNNSGTLEPTPALPVYGVSLPLPHTTQPLNLSYLPIAPRGGFVPIMPAPSKLGGDKVSKKLANASYILERIPCEEDGNSLDEMFGLIFKAAAEEVQDAADSAQAYREVYRFLGTLFADPTTGNGAPRGHIDESVKGTLSEKARTILHTLIENLYTRLKTVGCLEHRRHAVRKLELARAKIRAETSKKRLHSAGDIQTEGEWVGHSGSGAGGSGGEADGVGISRANSNGPAAEVSSGSGVGGILGVATTLPNVINPLNLPVNLLDPFKAVRKVAVEITIPVGDQDGDETEGDDREMEGVEEEI